MNTSSERFQYLAFELVSQVERLSESSSSEDRTRLLRRMKVLIVEIDMLILSSLKRDNHEITGSPLAKQSRAGSL
jgi:hypothetical protein